MRQPERVNMDRSTTPILVWSASTYFTVEVRGYFTPHPFFLNGHFDFSLISASTSSVQQLSLTPLVAPKLLLCFRCKSMRV
jgi:hypothetical protein